MKVAILSANLGNFDSNTHKPVVQETPEGVSDIVFHRFTDEDFPPIAGLSGRFQYRIPKMFGWQMYPGYDVYIWLDGTISFKRPDSVKWYLEQLGNNDAVFFRHPWRHTIQQETDHIEERLSRKDAYITPRYENGLHKEAYAAIKSDLEYADDRLFASTVFVYRNTPKVQTMLQDWFLNQARYYTCDQIVLPYILWKHKLSLTEINENLFKLGHVSLMSHHR